MIRYFWPSDDEQLAGQWQDSHFDEDAGWWVSTLQAGATFALAAALSTAIVTTAAAQAVFSQSQDDPAGNLINQPAVQEEYWINPVAPAVWLQPSVITDDDVHPTFVSAFTPDDGDQWHQLVVPAQATNYVALPLGDFENTPQFPAANNPNDGSDFWAPQQPPWDPNWTLTISLDDGAAVPPFQPDEDFLPAQAVPVPYNWPQPQQPFAEPDDNYLVPEFVAAEDPIWLQLASPVPGSLIWPQQFVFDQDENAANLAAFTDEVYQPSLVQPVADSLYILRQDLFDEQLPAGSLTLTLDDSFQPLVIPGVPIPDSGSLLLLQQWPFEQNEPAGSLRNNVDEDFWTPQIPPTNWPQPFVFTSDEVVPPPATTVHDEDFWNLLVLPVAASNYVVLPYVPDPEEIPAGSLVPFIPPPPSFCPVPPPGPDADTSMSIFSNFKGGPVLALFCRICKSGKPLVVRADYAIWCQDCCAFVSKQDTYMGTTQAPGQFKGRF